MFIVLFIDYRTHKTMLFELGIDVGIPIDNVHKIIEIALFFGRTVFPKQIFGNAMPAEQNRLIHRIYVRSELRFVRTQACGRMQNSRRNVPARVEFYVVCLRIIEQAVIAFGEILKAFLYIFLFTIGIKTEKRVWEFCAVVVHLSGEKIHFGLTVATHSLCVFVAMMDVMRKRSRVVEKFREHRPFMVFIPKIFADYFAFKFVHHIAEQNLLLSVRRNDVRKPLVLGCAGSILRPGGGRKPSFVYSALIKP